MVHNEKSHDTMRSSHLKRQIFVGSGKKTSIHTFLMRDFANLQYSKQSITLKLDIKNIIKFKDV